jgi:ABC-type uncharacterized transport system involved in gliding motility auxiliary subunit
MLGKLGLKLFLSALFAIIIIYHFVPGVWEYSWVPLTSVSFLGVGFVLWIVFSIEWLVTWFKKRSSQWGLSIIVSTIGVVGILSVLNWTAVQKNKKWDVTRNKLHSLSDQTTKILQNLKEDITLEVWTTNIKEMSGSTDMSSFLESYKEKSKGKLSLKVRNPNAERVEAIQAKITRKDVIIARASSGRESRVDNFSTGRAEEQITNAIVQAIKGRKKTLCFLDGHGEIKASGREGGEQAMSISQLKEALESASYQTKELTLATEKTVPSDCELIASVGPRSAPSENEVKLLKEYLAQGGKLFAFWGLETPAAWNSIIEAYGVRLENNVLIDERVQGAPGVYTKSFSPESDITRNFNSPLFMLLARSIVVPKAAPPNVTARAIATTEAGTLQKIGDLKSLKGGSVARSSLSKANSLPLIVEITQPVKTADTKEKTKSDKEATEKQESKETGILLIGNQMLASNGLIGQFGNMDFLMNSFSYLVKDTDLIGIRPKEVKSAKLDLTANSLKQVQGYLLLSTLMFIVFAVLLGFGRKTNIPV